ncbi:fungal-specific transcription factor domain-containing protein [Aspergillus pseudocaelatus]|uniref:Fungal-specific transcription factor domain-containing protein n=1 Tax=Aspergillus pseudocaelatus TaxID=1825620 RepID=A0ABQ6WXJ6_9EURO|nr:fungal-specific transcription factor domain-containing protein [Aspergillus pseudocaelatus]
MFHNLSDFVQQSATQGSNLRKNTRSQPKVNRSCVECRRRKIRCDAEELTRTVNHQRIILQKLFPSYSLDALICLSREELLQVIVAEGPTRDIATATELNTTVIRESDHSDEDRQLEENRKLSKGTSNVYDDVNGLSLSFDRQQTSLGILSVRFILRLLVERWPTVRTKLYQKRCRLEFQHQSYPHPRGPRETIGSAPVSMIDEVACIDAYFKTANSITPMIDETQFRREYSSGVRKDAGWLALRSMVLVVGSIAASEEGSRRSHAFYASVRQHIGLESFGSASIESLQALCLLGGYYLHYRNTPNMASAVLGAAFRMATALGLHKEPIELKNPEESLESHFASREARRRTWWSLFCLDTWASMTLGRPTFGRWDPDTMDVSLPKYGKNQSHRDIIITAFRANVEFCKLATEIQKRLAQSDPPTTGEINDFDTALRGWHDEALTAISHENCPDDFIVVRDYMRNRYMNVRMLLLRSVLLRHVQDKTQFEDLTGDDREAIVNCQRLSLEAIRNIACCMRPDSFWVWGSTWYLYQSCLVPLMMLLAFPCRPELAPCYSEIEQALAAFKSFIPWNAAARRSHDVVESIYEASKNVTELEVSRGTLPPFGEMDMEFWNLAAGGFEYDYEWESLIDWEKTSTPNVED